MLTKLQAVNIILDSIGETPISSLTSGLPDGESAEAKLDEVKLEVLSKGWHYNTEDIKLKRNYQNEILLPVTYMRVDTIDSDRDTNVSVRVNLSKRKLYDLTKKVFTFDKDLLCRVTVNFEFEDLTIEHSPGQFTGLITLALSASDAAVLQKHLEESGWNVHAPR